MKKKYTAVVKIEGRFFPYFLTDSLTDNLMIIKKIEGQSERKWFWACMAAEALNNL